MKIKEYLEGLDDHGKANLNWKPDAETRGIYVRKTILGYKVTPSAGEFEARIHPEIRVLDAIDPKLRFVAQVNNKLDDCITDTTVFLDTLEEALEFVNLQKGLFFKSIGLQEKEKAENQSNEDVLS